MVSLVAVDPLARDVLYGAIGLWVVVEFAGSFFKQGDRSRDAGSQRWFLFSLVVGLVLVFLVASRVPVTAIPGWVPVGLGVALMLAGSVLRQWAIATSAGSSPAR